MKIELNKQYVRRDGSIVTIVSNDGHDTYPWNDNTGTSYTKGGRFLSGIKQHDLDLIRPEKPEPRAIKRLKASTTAPSLDDDLDDIDRQHKAGAVRAFDTGATRSADTGRYDPEGFLSPLAIERYSLYMAKNQVQPDGNVRASDNWQKGLPIESYMKGMWRHMLHLWTRHRGYPVQDDKAAADKEEDLAALLFNVQGMLHELVKARLAKEAAGGQE